MVALMCCCHSIAPCTFKDHISASGIGHLQGIFWEGGFNIQVGLNKLPLAAFVAYHEACHSALLHREYSR